MFSGRGSQRGRRGRQSSSLSAMLSRNGCDMPSSHCPTGELDWPHPPDAAGASDSRASSSSIIVRYDRCSTRRITAFCSPHIYVYIERERQREKQRARQRETREREEREKRERRERERGRERSHSDAEHGCLRRGQQPPREAHTAHRAEARKARPLRHAPMVLRYWCPALWHGGPYARANVFPCLPSPYTRTPHCHSSGSVDPGAKAGGAGAVGGASEPRLCPSVAAQPRTPCKSLDT
jgi:hypothetical protein